MFHKSENEKSITTRKSTQLKNEENNPCIKEQELSYKCLNDHNYDKNMCAVAFANYKTCKEFWNRVRINRRNKGIIPHIPPPEEREKIKQDYFNRAKHS